MNVNLTQMNTQELEALYKTIELEIRNRKVNRRNELIDNVITAIIALQEEFPDTSLEVEYECAQCDCCDTVDILKYFDNLSRSDFGGYWL